MKLHEQQGEMEPNDIGQPEVNEKRNAGAGGSDANINHKDQETRTDKVAKPWWPLTKSLHMAPYGKHNFKV